MRPTALAKLSNGVALQVINSNHRSLGYRAGMQLDPGEVSILKRETFVSIHLSEYEKTGKSCPFTRAIIVPDIVDLRTIT